MPDKKRAPILPAVKGGVDGGPQTHAEAVNNIAFRQPKIPSRKSASHDVTNNLGKKQHQSADT